MSRQKRYVKDEERSLRKQRVSDIRKAASIKMGTISKLMISKSSQSIQRQDASVLLARATCKGDFPFFCEYKLYLIILYSKGVN
ncbi:MAG: hypothetical protein WBI07_13155 [Mobilitalea sp.]